MASGGSADVGAAGFANAESASPPCPPGQQPDRSPPPGFAPHIQRLSSSSSVSSASRSHPPLTKRPPREGPSTPRRTPVPISFPPVFIQLSQAPSTTLAPSTAEGKPVPFPDAADSRRTSALQKLNSKYPSAVRRHGYAPEASTAQSSTYSQPVLVRTYSGPPPSQTSRGSRSRNYRPPSSSRSGSRRVPLPSPSTPGSHGLGLGQPVQPTVTDVVVGTTSSSHAGWERRNPGFGDGDVYGVRMPPLYKPKKAASSNSNNTSKLSLPWPWQALSRQQPEEPKLPPLEAFSFKSFMADLQTPGGENDIGADLDRIAEICARSRYSLSNQYEVHVAPHGSGAAFVSGGGTPSAPRRKGHSRSRSHGTGGPTLQAITSDDENPARSNVRRRTGGRRKSVAYGTLETIMSSSRSSEEDKAKKKSAAELVGEVRGRAAKKAWAGGGGGSGGGGGASNPSGSGSGSGSGGSGSGNTAAAATSASASTGNGDCQDAGQQTATSPGDGGRLARKKSASFAVAVMDSGRSSSEKTSTSSSARPKHPTTTTDLTTTTSSPPTTSTTPLHSEPARPQTSTSHLGVRTSSSAAAAAAAAAAATPSTPTTSPHTSLPAANDPGLGDGDSSPQRTEGGGGGGGGGGSGSWGPWMIPWRGAGPGGLQQQQAKQQGTQVPVTAPTVGVGVGVRSHAEGSLRLLLRGAAGGGSAGGERGGESSPAAG